MDASFDFGGGGGWGEMGQDNFNASQGVAQKSSNSEKVPIPVTVADLCESDIQEEKFYISSFSFHTVRTIGKVVTADSQSDGQYTYEICDTTAIDPNTAPRYTVIRYHGIDGATTGENFVEGTTVCVVGKLRKFDAKISIIAFHLREVEGPEEEKAFHMECKLAQLYYGKNIPDATATGGPEMRQYDGTIFTTELPGRPAPDTPSSRGRMGVPMTPGGANPAARRSTFNDAPANTRGLTGQKAKIFDYIRRNGGSEQGCHVDDIKRGIGADGRFASDIEALVNEGTIYSSLDEFHYAIID